MKHPDWKDPFLNKLWPGKILGLLIIIVWLAVGSVIGFFGGRDLWKSYQMNQWPKTSGIILTSDVVNDFDEAGSDESEDYSVHLTYRYFVDEIEYVGDIISVGYHGSRSARDAWMTEALYPAGREVTVHYPPDQPWRSVLETSVGFMNILLTCAGILMLLIGGLAANSLS